MEKMPLLNCLPKLQDRVTFTKQFTKIPNLRKDGTKQERIIETDKIKTEFFLGLSRHYYFCEHFLTNMMLSYSVRSSESLIKKLKDNKGLNIDERIALIEDYIRYKPAVYGSYLMGIAGCGKTTIIKLLCSLFPLTIPHPEFGLTQVPVLLVQTPHRGSRIDLCKAIISELGSVTKNKYKAESKRYTEYELTEFVRILCITHLIGTIILDEIQDLKGKGKGTDPSQQTLDFIKYISNRIGVPFVFVGSTEAKSLLFKTFQLATRNQGFIWDRLEYNIDPKSEWSHFMNSLFKLQVLKGNQQITPELNRLYHHFTQGVPRMLSILHCEAQKIALHYNREEIEPIDLYTVAESLFNSTDYAIEGIRNYEVEILAKYSDLLDIQNFKHPEKNEQKESSHRKSTQQESKTNSKHNPPTSDESILPSPLIELTKNCKTASEIRTMFIENKIIKSIPELIES
ncbi:MAG: AAA family ATPase [Cyclobacteriaceae bacterium]